MMVVSSFIIQMMNAVLIYSNSQTTSLFAFDYVKELRKDELEKSTLSIASGVFVCVRFGALRMCVWLRSVN